MPTVSRLFYRGSDVGDTAMNELINNVMNVLDLSEQNEATYRNIESSYLSWMSGALNALDNRLYWNAYASEVWYMDSGESKPLPFADSSSDAFKDWWKEQTDSWIELGKWESVSEDDAE